MNNLTPEDRINTAINFALRVGDRDECFSKHVGHTLSAIYVGNGFNNPVDYTTPGSVTKEQQSELNDYWEDAQFVYEEIGKEEFRYFASLHPGAAFFDDRYIEQAENFKKDLSKSA